VERERKESAEERLLSSRESRRRLCLVGRVGGKDQHITHTHTHTHTDRERIYLYSYLSVFICMYQSIYLSSGKRRLKRASCHRGRVVEGSGREVGVGVNLSIYLSVCLSMEAWQRGEGAESVG